MDPIAVSQAEARLRKAEKALTAIKDATSLDEADEAWTDFLLAASTIYTKLEQGAKGHKKSMPWFGQKKNERKSDPLLRYLHFARSSDEHGVQRVSAMTGPNFEYPTGRPLKFNERKPMKVSFKDPEGNPVVMDAVLSGPTLKPIRASDTRYGDFCDPPTSHLGRDIQFAGFIDSLAEAALPYLRDLVSEALELSKAIAK